MRRLLILLSGARRDILDLAPGDRPKFEGLGGAVLITSALAGMSMAFALNTALGMNVVFAIAAGVPWGLAIMSLDRWLVASLPYGAGARRLLFALPRLLLALLLGVVISTPLVLQIFRPEVEAQIVVIKQRSAEQFIARQNSSATAQEITRLEGYIENLQKVISSGGEVGIDPAQDPQIRSLTADLQRAMRTRDQAYEEWQCLLNGGSRCGGNSANGLGPPATQAQRRYDQASRQVDDLNHQINLRKAELGSQSDTARRQRLQQARRDLPPSKAQLDRLLTTQRDLQVEFDAKNRDTDGLLIRLQALDEVSGNNATLNTARLLLLLFITTTECLPVIVAILHRPGLYERLLAHVLKEEELAVRRRTRVELLATESAPPARDVLSPSPGDDADPLAAEVDAEHADRLLRGMVDRRSE